MFIPGSLYNSRKAIVVACRDGGVQCEGAVCVCSVRVQCECEQKCAVWV